MNEIQIFNNEEFGNIRTITIDNEVWFVATDVAKALGYSNPRKAVIDHCKGVTKRDTPTSSGVQSISYINEGDMYRLIMRSKLPSAEKFEDWVVNEVLPSIRKHGGYIREIVNTELSPELQMLQGLLSQMVQKELADKERDKQIAEARKIADKAVETTENIKEAVKPVFDNWREEINKKIKRIQYYSKIDFQTLNTQIYSELERRAGCDLGTRLRNLKQRMYDAGRMKTEINNTRKIDVIENDKKLREIFSKIVSEYEIKYCA